mmetsp:Transcript_3557/g.7109  ORF Transcript_3557/g.7109 Transcript_3557/m.7109 type:complete len:83 (+) Transcript_3557:226-474(+)
MSWWCECFSCLHYYLERLYFGTSVSVSMGIDFGLNDCGYVFVCILLSCVCVCVCVCVFVRMLAVTSCRGDGCYAGILFVNSG